MKKILVVEDSDVIRVEIVEILKMEGFHVIEAINGLEGLSIVRTENPDIIISDILMPKLDGYQMLKELRKHSITDNIPLIFLSAKAEKKDIRKGMNLGADDYLVKPVNYDDLIIAIQNKLKKQELINLRLNRLRNNISQSLPHELRTPLNGILGFSNMLKDISEDCEIDEINKMGSYIYESGVRLHKVIENFLLYSSLIIEISDPDMKKRECPYIDTKNIIESKVNEIGEKEDRVSDITMDLSEFKLNISIDDLSKIIEELVSNGIKFSVPGESIKISSGREMQSFFISVRNEGVGMSPADIANIDGFMQFDRQKMEQQGMGLGLGIVNLLTLIYKCEIEIESKPTEYFDIKLSFPQ